MQNIALASKERKELISLTKRESKPSSRLRMHIGLLASDGYSPTHICRVLFCSRTTVYSITRRFCWAGRVAFHDRQERFWTSRRERGSRHWWKRIRLRSMDGCAHAGVAPF